MFILNDQKTHFNQLRRSLFGTHRQRDKMIECKYSFTISLTRTIFNAIDTITCQQKRGPHLVFIVSFNYICFISQLGYCQFLFHSDSEINRFMLSGRKTADPKTYTANVKCNTPNVAYEIRNVLKVLHFSTTAQIVLHSQAI